MTPIEHHSLPISANPSPIEALDMDRLIKALETVENGKPHTLGGKLCWTEAAWKEDAGWMPFTYTHSSYISRSVAKRRLTRISKRMEAVGIQVSPYSLACIWNLGLAGTVKFHKASNGTSKLLDYAVRVKNVYEDRNP